jgi:hypothetical protein
MLIKFIKNTLFLLSNQEWLLWISSGHIKECCMSSFTNMTVQQASSQQLLFPLDLFFSATEMELIEELKLALVNTGFVLKTLVKIMLSFLVPQ